MLKQARVITAVDLFAGAGGLTCGLQMAGVKVVQAINSNPHAAASFRRNNPEVDIVTSDIRNVGPLSTYARTGFPKRGLDWLVAGLPCQGFSESNRRTRTLHNPKNHLYREVLRFIRALRPKCFIVENVAGLATLKKGAILNTFVRTVRDYGYTTDWALLCAADYGIPQIRRRIFIIGNRLDLPVTFPAATHGDDRASYVTVRDALTDLPYLPNGASIDYLRYRRSDNLCAYQTLMRSRAGAVVQGNLVTRSNELVLERYKHVRQDENWTLIPARLMRNYTDRDQCHTGLYHRLSWRVPSKVIGNFRKNMLIHPSQNRGLSVREAARLQSFPDHHEFVGSIGFQQQQVADAVPPMLAKAVVTHLISAWKV